ncbi:MAG: hypothetical protein Q3960_03695 [Lactobacillus sp.]|nr:hypothetical protein [Lactobacillus sp.]
MKRKLPIVAIICALLAFITYTSTIKHAKQKTIQVVGVSKTVKVNHKKAGNDSLTSQLQDIIGSQRVAAMVTKDGKTATFSQADQYSLGKGKEALVLAALLYGEEHGYIKNGQTAKVKKGDKTVKSHIAYGIAFLRQAMIKGSKAAIATLERVVKKRSLKKYLQASNLTYSDGKMSLADFQKLVIGVGLSSKKSVFLSAINSKKKQGLYHFGNWRVNATVVIYGADHSLDSKILSLAA